MKIIDHTPFFDNETGKIKFMDRARAIMQYGTGWIEEVEAQQQVTSAFAKILDRNYTLLRNVTPAGFENSFPLILVGPPGVFVMYATPMSGIYRAKGDQWGTISGNSFKNEKPNLLNRTERMARAIRVFLQRRGFPALLNIDAALLCTNPALNVDSVRPIIRVVLRDALERFAISISQARVELSHESVQEIVQHLLSQPIQASAKDTQEPASEPASNAVPGVQNAFEAVPSMLDADDSLKKVPASAIQSATLPLWANNNATTPLEGETPRRRFTLNRKQLLFLIGIFIIWCLMVTVFLVIVVRDQGFGF